MRFRVVRQPSWELQTHDEGVFRRRHRRHPPHAVRSSSEETPGQRRSRLRRYRTLTRAGLGRKPKTIRREYYLGGKHYIVLRRRKDEMTTVAGVGLGPQARLGAVSPALPYARRRRERRRGVR